MLGGEHARIWLHILLLGDVAQIVVLRHDVAFLVVCNGRRPVVWQSPIVCGARDWVLLVLEALGMIEEMLCNFEFLLRWLSVDRRGTMPLGYLGGHSRNCRLVRTVCHVCRLVDWLSSGREWIWTCALSGHKGGSSTRPGGSLQ